MAKNTANTGAAIERGKLLAKLRRMAQGREGINDYNDGYLDALGGVIDWVKKSAARAQAKPGGLGRKAKALKAATK